MFHRGVIPKLTAWPAMTILGLFHVLSYLTSITKLSILESVLWYLCYHLMNSKDTENILNDNAEY